VDARPYTVCYGIEVSGYDFAYYLVAGNDSGLARREFAFNDVEVGAADSAGAYPEKNVAGFRLGCGDVFDF